MNIECLLDYAAIVAGSPFPVHLAVRFKAKAAENTRTRPIAFCPVLDRSGSMSGEPLDYAKQAAQLVVKHLRPSDYFGLVTFDDEAQTVIPLQKITNKAEAHARIEAIREGGSTNLCGGFLLGREELSRAPEGVTRKALLLSDGHLNCGITEPGRVASIAGSALEKDGVRTSCLGFGEGYNQEVMSDMARKANGTFYDATSPEKLPAIFQAELEGLMSIASQNVRLRLKPLDFCHQFASLGSLPHVLLPDKRWEFHIGDLVSDEERWAVFALDVLSLPIGADGRPVASLEGEPLIEVEVVWDELGETEVTSHTHQQIVRIQAVQKPEDVKLNAEVLPWVASQRAGKTVEDAMTDVNRNDLKAAKGKLSELKEALGRYGHNDKVVDGLKLIQRTLDSIECGDVGESFKKRSTGNAHFYMRGSTAEMHTQACEDAPSWAGKQIEEDATYQETVKRKKKGKRPDDTQPPTA